MGRPGPTRITEEEFLKLPETLDKVELIDGEVVVSPSPSFFHQEVLRRLAAQLDQWVRAQERRVTIGQSPLDVRFAPGRILQPDLFVLFDEIPLRHDGPIDRVPELCIEIVSPSNPTYDRFSKRLIYAEAGVKELWTIEPGYYVERWSGGNLREVEKLESSVASPLLPGLAIDLGELFAE